MKKGEKDKPSLLLVGLTLVEERTRRVSCSLLVSPPSPRISTVTPGNIKAGGTNPEVTCRG